MFGCLRIFFRINVSMRVWVGGGGDKEESASGYFQLCPFSYLMVFIGAKGQQCCVLCAFPNAVGKHLAPCCLVCSVSLKMHSFSPRGAVTPQSVNLLSGKYQVTKLRKSHVSHLLRSFTVLLEIRNINNQIILAL